MKPSMFKSFCVILILLTSFGCSNTAPPYTFVKSWGAEGINQGQFQGPIGIAVDASGNVYVSDSGNNKILKFDSKGNFLSEWGESEQPSRPMHITISNKRLYVAEFLNDRVWVSSLAGKELQTIGSSGKGEGEFDAPAGVTVDAVGNLYVVDFYNHRVQKFGPEGNFKQELGEYGNDDGQFTYPTDIAIAPDGSIVVADAYAHRIQVFSQDGKFIRKWGSKGSNNGQFDVATGVAVDKEGTVYVADFYNNRIQVFTIEGKFITSFGSEGQGKLTKPTDMVVNQDHLFVVDFGNNRIQQFKIQR